MPSSTHQFTRNASCPTQDTLSARTNTLVNRKYSSSTNTLHYNVTPGRSLSAPTKETNSNILQRIKTGVINFFKSHPTKENLEPVKEDFQQSIFNYDPDLDLSEEHITLISKRLLTTLRESKIKHLSCDHLYLPCNHLRNIARQCLIMSAEEPFGIMGAQIKIKLTLCKSTVVKYLPIIRIDPQQKTIFEIEIDLHEDAKVLTLRRFLPEMKMFEELKEKSPLYVSPRCVLVKNVFYKTAQPKRAIIDT